MVGVSGPIGLGQRFEARIHEMWKAGAFKSSTPAASMQAIREALWPIAAGEFQAAAQAQQLVGGAAAASAISSSLIALPVAGTPCLFQFDQQLAPEQATAKLPFVAVGSGQPIADPFLAFLRGVLWPDRLPTLSEGVLAAVWCLAHAIETNPGGVAEPIQVVVLSKNGKECAAQELPDEEVTPHREFIEEAKRELGRFLREKFQPGAQPTPDLPIPPTAGE